MEIKKNTQHLYNMTLIIFQLKSTVKVKSGTNFIRRIPKMPTGYCDDDFSQISKLYLASENFNTVA